MSGVTLPAQGVNGSTLPTFSTTQLADASHVENIVIGTVNGGIFYPSVLALDSSLQALLALMPISLGQKNMAGSSPVVIASDQPALPVVSAPAANAALTNVPAATASTTLQPLNAGRKGLVVVNDSTAILYVKFGANASPTSWTYFLAGSSGGIPATLELPAVVFTGLVTGAWASPTGFARVTELT